MDHLLSRVMILKIRFFRIEAIEVHDSMARGTLPLSSCERMGFFEDGVGVKTT